MTSKDGRKLYPLADYTGIGASTPPAHMVNVRAVKTGETRPPRTGEWYISGAIPGAYRAPADLSDDYAIAKLVTVRSYTVTEVTGDFKG